MFLILKDKQGEGRKQKYINKIIRNLTVKIAISYFTLL